MTNGNELMQQVPPPSRIARIEERIDRQAAGAMVVSDAFGGMRFQNMLEVLEFSKMMAISDVAVPKHLRGNPGACMAVVLQAVEWRMSPYAVANKSYVVNDRIGYESQLIHAVIEQRAPLVGRLRCRYTGEGIDRRCVVWAYVKGEADPFEFQSAPFHQIQPKNSPLWKTKPDLQLFYNASRDWARMYFPDVILGVYADDEIDQLPAASAVQPTRPFGMPQIRQHPTAENLVIDTTTSNEPPAISEAEANRIIEEKARQTRGEADRQPQDGPAETDVAGVDAEPPAEDLTSESAFVEAAESVARQQNVSPDVFDAAVARLRVSDGIGGGRRRDTEARQRIYAAMAAGRFDWANARILN